MVERDIVERLCRYDGLGVVLVPVEVLRAAEAEIRRLRSAAPSDRDVVRKAELERALEKIGAWAKAYPIAVFPEPDLKRAHEVLSANGISLDAISASNMRHVIAQVQEIVEHALRGPGGGE